MHLLIPAAGSGKRMGSDRNKLLLSLHGQPILAWTLLSAAAADRITWIGIISQPIDQPDFYTLVQDLNLQKPVVLIDGGSTRQESVERGLQALPAEADRVLIHDGARCLVTPDLLNCCATHLLTDNAALIAAIPVKDTIKVVNAEGWIEHTLDRSQLWAAQTPQGFTVAQLKACHERARIQGWEVTDDAALLERCHLPVKIVPGEETNLKVTTPTDLAIAALILQKRFQE
ncbi:2-C-methyl-D-erythritol 4-phosphate cytidylyltransferase [Trichothermofontia sp.]